MRTRSAFGDPGVRWGLIVAEPAQVWPPSTGSPLQLDGLRPLRDTWVTSLEIPILPDAATNHSRRLLSGDAKQRSCFLSECEPDLRRSGGSFACGRVLHLSAREERSGAGD